MDDKFKVLMNEAVQLIHKGDLVNARIKYNSLISYQRERVGERPDSCEDKAMLGCALSLVGFDDDIPADKKLSILDEAVSLFDEVSKASGFVLEPNLKGGFCDVFDGRGRIFFDAQDYDSALNEFNKAIKLYAELKESRSGLNIQMWSKLAGLLAIKAKALIDNDRSAPTADKALKPLNNAIAIMEHIKQSAPEAYEGFKDILPLWIKLRDDLNAFTTT